MPSLLVFQSGIGIGHDASADVELKAVAVGVDGANRDAAGEVAVESDGGDGTAVAAARNGLEFGDYLHGANLGRAGDRSSGETGGENVCRRNAGARRGGDTGFQVVHGGEGAQPEEFRNGHGARCGDTSQIIAEYVDDHDVFGTVLGAAL